MRSLAAVLGNTLIVAFSGTRFLGGLHAKNVCQLSGPVVLWIVSKVTLSSHTLGMKLSDRIRRKRS